MSAGDATVLGAAALVALAIILRWHRRKRRRWSIHLSIESDEMREDYRDAGGGSGAGSPDPPPGPPVQPSTGGGVPDG